MPAAHAAPIASLGSQHGATRAKIRQAAFRRATYTALAAALLLPSIGCYQDPEQILQQQQLMNDMSDAVNEIGLRMADLQATVDSLSAVVARQDTVIYRMANVNGIPYQLR